MLQGGTAEVAPGKSCGVGAIAQLSSGGYGVRDTPLQRFKTVVWLQYLSMVWAVSLRCVWCLQNTCSFWPV